MSSARSHLGFTGLASKQLAGEWEAFKRQGDEEILIQLWVFPNGGVIFTTSLQSLTLTHSPISSVSFHTEDNFLKAAVGKREERERKKDSAANRKWGEIKKNERYKRVWSLKQC